MKIYAKMENDRQLAYRFLVLIVMFVATESEKPPDCSHEGVGYCPYIPYPQSSCIRVASLELRQHVGSNCHLSSASNLAIFESSVEIAARHGAQMIVFPEDGIAIGPKENIVECIEEIPDPMTLSEEDRNPCLSSSSSYQSMPVLTKLSCMAQKNKLYLIANYGTKHSCKAGQKVNSEICPVDGFFTLNTDVVFDPSGDFIRRYRKYNPFSKTEIFDKAPSLEHTFFDTPYGRFGLFTCFDLIFKRPALDLVEQYVIDSVIFPTWWYDELPILSAIQYQDGWSRANKVNMISSNIYRPELGSMGSGIFSANHTLTSGTHQERAKLLIANVAKPGTNDCDNEIHGGFRPQIVPVDEKESGEEYTYLNTEILKTDSVTLITTPQGELTRCSGDVCCTIIYDAEPIESGQLEKSLIMIVRDSPRAGYYGWYEQFCVVATINKTMHSNNHIDLKNLVYDKLAAFNFRKLKLRMSATTKYVYPFGAHNVTNLIERKNRNYNCDTRKQENSFGTDKDLDNKKETICEHDLLIMNVRHLEVYSFGLYGRRYESDVVPKEKVIPKPITLTD